MLTGENQHAVQKVEAMILDVATTLGIIPFELHAERRSTIADAACQGIGCLDPRGARWLDSALMRITEDS
jgi:hypothetical protein